MKNSPFARIPLWAANAEISLQAWRVLTAIAGHLDRTGWAYPSYTRIAALSGIARNNIPRVVTELEDAGLLRRERTTGGRGNPTRYQVVFEEPDMFPPRNVISPDDVVSGNSISRDDVSRPKRHQKEPETSSPQMTEHKEQRKRESQRARESSFMTFRVGYL
jgi:hypothetical protein